ncbi:hypothetical protein H4Q26_001416 [Puccinia striiformis f. sp. tritici PST-130]|nr:hypothetical protein H4Q26_001416 [Puccinia striiformis f. sp. tritici PST-130]
MKVQLLDPLKSLFERYRAMFGLRDSIRRATESEGWIASLSKLWPLASLIPALCSGKNLYNIKLIRLTAQNHTLRKIETCQTSISSLQSRNCLRFGQLSHPLSVPALVKVLENKQEDEMVRHEAAEALGSIATPEVLTALKAHASMEEQSRVVRESCEVALDMYEHERSQEFQYTLPLKST